MAAEVFFRFEVMILKFISFALAIVLLTGTAKTPLEVKVPSPTFESIGLIDTLFSTKSDEAGKDSDKDSEKKESVSPETVSKPGEKTPEPVSPEDITCPYYEGLLTERALIPSKASMPEAPLTTEEFEQLWDYIAVNEKTHIQIHYGIPYKNEYQDMLYTCLRDMVERYSYEKPEYFNYLRKVSFKVEIPDDEKSFDLSISWAPSDSSISDGITCRRQAFQKAIEVRNQLYADGTLSSEMSEKDRAHAFMDWLRQNLTYKDDGTAMGHTAWSAFFKGYGVCDAYSSAYNLLLKLDGIECKGQKGVDKRSGAYHHWTVAVLDGESLNIDSTWCDGWRFFNEKYFAVPDDEFSKTHTWEQTEKEKQPASE